MVYKPTSSGVPRHSKFVHQPIKSPRPSGHSHNIDQIASEDLSRATEIAELKADYSKKLRSLEEDLSKAGKQMAFLQRELKLKSDTVKEHSELKASHDELRKRHQTVTDTLEAQLKPDRSQSDVISMLRKQIIDMAKQREEQSDVHRKEMEVKIEERKAFAAAAGKDRQTAEFYLYRLGELQDALEDNPKILTRKICFHIERSSCSTRRKI